MKKGANYKAGTDVVVHHSIHSTAGPGLLLILLLRLQSCRKVFCSKLVDLGGVDVIAER